MLYNLKLILCKYFCVDYKIKIIVISKLKQNYNIIYLNSIYQYTHQENPIQKYTIYNITT